MSDEIPSPAGTRRQAEPSRNGPAKLPWESALYEAVAALEHRAEEAEAERDRLVLENHVLRKQLREARSRLENWKLRQESWRRERAEILGRQR